jgi:hypothetical protein
VTQVEELAAAKLDASRFSVPDIYNTGQSLASGPFCRNVKRKQIMEAYLNNKLKKPKKPKETLSGRKTH